MATRKDFDRSQGFPEIDHKTIQGLMQELADTYGTHDAPRATTLPGIDLYVDQITTLLTENLSQTLRYPGDKIMTKTMINNYTKNKLLPPPVKKKYSRDHLILLILIYYFKSFMSISDIQALLAPLSDHYYQERDPKSRQSMLDKVFDTLFSKEPEIVESLFTDIHKHETMAQSMFNDFPEQDQAYLKELALISMLSFDIYIKKQLIERIIDETL